MNRRTNVDATPCFLPLFLLFGLGSGGAAGTRPYGGYGGYGVPGYDHGAVRGFGYRYVPGQVAPHAGSHPGAPSYYSPRALGTPSTGTGTSRRGPIMF
ncbi:hypothetical protein [Alicyclobacillus dauci]|uniref:Uncharacterized protein n=1 Tax=Alicyclobacillus dauci TaxID=1475485 RepID=A0ABY6Z329_9BACL|nr:hypothetical protein [Alicyclobacillus dauci]WAH36689.1 hypothetical protein NZD86_21350 [Alicyclobacillus dauci]